MHTTYNNIYKTYKTPYKIYTHLYKIYKTIQTYVKPIKTYPKLCVLLYFDMFCYVLLYFFLSPCVRLSSSGQTGRHTDKQINR